MFPSGGVVQTADLVWTWLTTALLGRLVLSVLILFGGWYVSNLAVRVLGRPAARRFQRPSITRTVLRSVKASIFLASVLLAAYVMGLAARDIVLSVTVFSVVVGIILAPIAGSVINGLFVLADRPYEIGDMVELVDTGQRGFVEDITLRYTKIISEDNTILVISNSSIRERDVINYSAEDERTRLTLDLTVSYEGDLDQARSLVERAARDVPGVVTGGPTIRIGAARYPAVPRCYVRSFGDNGVELRLRYWARTPFYLTRVRSAVHEQVWAALDEAGIDVTIPYPHRHLVFGEDAGGVGSDPARLGAVEAGDTEGGGRDDTGEG